MKPFKKRDFRAARNNAADPPSNCNLHDLLASSRKKLRGQRPFATKSGREAPARVDSGQECKSNHKGTEMSEKLACQTGTTSRKRMSSSSSDAGTAKDMLRLETNANATTSQPTPTAERTRVCGPKRAKLSSQVSSTKEVPKCTYVCSHAVGKREERNVLVEEVTSSVSYVTPTLMAQQGCPELAPLPPLVMRCPIRPYSKEFTQSGSKLDAIFHETIESSPTVAVFLSVDGGEVAVKQYLLDLQQPPNSCSLHQHRGVSEDTRSEHIVWTNSSKAERSFNSKMVVLNGLKDIKRHVHQSQLQMCMHYRLESEPESNWTLSPVLFSTAELSSDSLSRIDHTSLDQLRHSNVQISLMVRKCKAGTQGKARKKRLAALSKTPSILSEFVLNKFNEWTLSVRLELFVSRELWEQAPGKTKLELLALAQITEDHLREMFSDWNLSAYETHRLEIKAMPQQPPSIPTNVSAQPMVQQPFPPPKPQIVLHSVGMMNDVVSSARSQQQDPYPMHPMAQGNSFGSSFGSLLPSPSFSMWDSPMLNPFAPYSSSTSLDQAFLGPSSRFPYLQNTAFNAVQSLFSKLHADFTEKLFGMQHLYPSSSSSSSAAAAAASNSSSGYGGTNTSSLTELLSGDYESWLSSPLVHDTNHAKIGPMTSLQESGSTPLPNAFDQRKKKEEEEETSQVEQLPDLLQDEMEYDIDLNMARDPERIVSQESKESQNGSISTEEEPVDDRDKSKEKRRQNVQKFPLYLVGTRDSFSYSLVAVDVLTKKVVVREGGPMIYPLVPDGQPFQDRQVIAVDWYFASKDSLPPNYDTAEYPLDPEVQLYPVGVRSYFGVFSNAEMLHFESLIDELYKESLQTPSSLLEETCQHTLRGSKVIRTKMFFNARYLWTKEQLESPDAGIAKGIRTDVSPNPPWMQEQMASMLENAGIISPGFVNSFASNIYHDGSEGLGQHFDDTERFRHPVVSVRLFSDSRLGFGCKLYGYSNGDFAIPMPRGATTVLMENGFASVKVKHCIRPADMMGKSGVLLFRHIREDLLQTANEYQQRQQAASQLSQDNASIAIASGGLLNSCFDSCMQQASFPVVQLE